MAFSGAEMRSILDAVHDGLEVLRKEDPHASVEIRRRLTAIDFDETDPDEPTVFIGLRGDSIPNIDPVREHLDEFLENNHIPPVVLEVATNRAQMDRIEWIKEFEPPPTLASDDHFLGGMPCYNVRDNKHHGTIAFMLPKFEYCPDCSDPADPRIKRAKPALVSNNHVIARSDLGRYGDTIAGSRYYDPIARLESFFPLSDTSHNVDFAVATVDSAFSTDPDQWGRFRGLGDQTLTGFDRAELVSSTEKLIKVGASTDITVGTRVAGMTDVYSGGRFYRGTVKMNPGFGFYGDSGALVMRKSDFKGLGILTWMDRSDTYKMYKAPTHTYFWPFFPIGSDPNRVHIVPATFP